MLWKCCVIAGKTNYRSQQDKIVCEMNKISVYHFLKERDEENQFQMPIWMLQTIQLFVNYIDLQILIL